MTDPPPATAPDEVPEPARSAARGYLTTERKSPTDSRVYTSRQMTQDGDRVLAALSHENPLYASTEVNVSLDKAGDCHVSVRIGEHTLVTVALLRGSLEKPMIDIQAA